VVHVLALDVSYALPGTDSVLRITSTVADLSRSAEGIEASKAHRQLRTTCGESGALAPRNWYRCRKLIHEDRAKSGPQGG
jgi:hypothetical protein